MFLSRPSVSAAAAASAALRGSRRPAGAAAAAAVGAVGLPSALPAALYAQTRLDSGAFRQPEPQDRLWAKPAIERRVLHHLFDMVPKSVPEHAIEMSVNLQKVLKFDKPARMDLYFELLETFGLEMDDTRHLARDFQSGREAADWIASRLEMQKRLVV
ncbi:hypothetical protein CXG81DRAFT_21042 [Caulochytrium protostelioides]|uniref:Uncharacterized protein n=1 Tax=Caulochytrium protostelioides TaxID=1555241 RepID=A0A4P9WZ23_9FUNG|nr:hypothetical protein CXG81DRAFT_21042 [Caulochytrium protostelioides]|eukprot:RKO98799.1 hypothetical protein CXG81DRAFT_21042 [Caulochytrium protostelioides]